MANKTTETDFELGWTPALAFNLIPKLNIEFDPPAQSIADALQKGTDSIIEFPISGKSPGIPDELKCEVNWKIKSESGIEDCGNVDGKIKKTADGVFKITDTQGNNLKIDIIGIKIIGKGILGYSIKPELPNHAAVENFPEELPFDNSVELVIPAVASAKIGQKINVNLKTTGVYVNADIRLIISENDEGENENKNAVGIQHTWKKGNSESWTWAVGFGDDGYGALTYPEPDESGTYEYDFTILARSGEMKEFVEIKKITNVVKNVKKPELSMFGLEYRKDLLGHTLIAKGTVRNLAPETQLHVGVNLMASTLPGDRFPETLNEKKCESAVDESGNFVIPIEWVFLESSKRKLNDYMGILYLPKLGNPNLPVAQHCAPVSWALDYDEKTFVSFNGKAFVEKNEGKWVCSKMEQLPAIKKKITNEDEFNILISTIYGEANTESSVSWQAIAFVIMNRVGKYEWSKYKTVTEIITKTGFDACTHKNSGFQFAMEYMKKKPDKKNEKLEKMIQLITPIYLKEQSDITDNAVFYYSPKAQAKLHAKNPEKYKKSPGFAISSKTKEVSISGLLNTDDFIFYKYITPSR